MYIKHHTKICCWYLLVVILKIDIKYTFLVRFHIFSQNDRLVIDQCDVIARADMENCYKNSSWGKGLIKSRNNESYSFIYNLSIFQANFCPYHTYSFVSNNIHLYKRQPLFHKGKIYYMFKIIAFFLTMLFACLYLRVDILLLHVCRKHIISLRMSE